MFLMLFAMIAFHGATPQDAAIHAVNAEKSAPIVLRTNIVGEYATVLTSGGRMEGSTVSVPILVKRFSFGWQALDVLDTRCALNTNRLEASTIDRLMRGMPRVNNTRCDGLRDAGSANEVARVRMLMRGPLVPYVVIAGDWAIGEWYGAGGGQSLYRRHRGEWQIVTTGGGAMNASEMRKFGVPRSASCTLTSDRSMCR